MITRGVFKCVYARPRCCCTSILRESDDNIKRPKWFIPDTYIYVYEWTLNFLHLHMCTFLLIEWPRSSLSLRRMVVNDRLGVYLVMQIEVARHYKVVADLDMACKESWCTTSTYSLKIILLLGDRQCPHTWRDILIDQSSHKHIINQKCRLWETIT